MDRTKKVSEFQYYDNLSSDPSEDQPLPIRLHTIGKVLMRKGHIVQNGNDLINTGCLIWVTSGRCRAVLNGMEVKMEKNHVCYALFREPYFLECLSEECACWLMGFCGAQAEAVVLAYRYPRFMITERDAEPLWEEIAALAVSNNPFHKRRTAALILDILAHAGGEDSRLNPEERLTDQALALINQHLGNPELGVDFLADRLSVSRSRLTNTFTRNFKCSPGRHILDRRRVKALSLLRGTDFAIGKIAEMCGFRDSRTFSRFIHRCCETGPMEFRKKFRENSARNGKSSSDDTP